MAENIRTILQEHIISENRAASLYRELAKTAPDKDAESLLNGFAEDEARHAAEFRRVYKHFFGTDFVPPENNTVLNGSYTQILRERVIDESGDYRIYGNQFYTATDSLLRKVLFSASKDENVHAVRLLYLLS